MGKALPLRSVAADREEYLVIVLYEDACAPFVNAVVPSWGEAVKLARGQAETLRRFGRNGRVVVAKSQSELVLPRSEVPRG